MTQEVRLLRSGCFDRRGVWAEVTSKNKRCLSRKPGVVARTGWLVGQYRQTDRQTTREIKVKGAIAFAMMTWRVGKRLIQEEEDNEWTQSLDKRKTNLLEWPRCQC